MPYADPEMPALKRLLPQEREQQYQQEMTALVDAQEANPDNDFASKVFHKIQLLGSTEFSKNLRMGRHLQTPGSSIVHIMSHPQLLEEGRKLLDIAKRAKWPPGGNTDEFYDAIKAPARRYFSLWSLTVSQLETEVTRLRQEAGLLQQVQWLQQNYQAALNQVDSYRDQLQTLEGMATFQPPQPPQPPIDVRLQGTEGAATGPPVNNTTRVRQNPTFVPGLGSAVRRNDTELPRSFSARVEVEDIAGNEMPNLDRLQFGAAQGLQQARGADRPVTGDSVFTRHLYPENVSLFGPECPHYLLTYIPASSTPRHLGKSPRKAESLLRSQGHGNIDAPRVRSEQRLY